MTRRFVPIDGSPEGTINYLRDDIIGLNDSHCQTFQHTCAMTHRDLAILGVNNGVPGYGVAYTGAYGSFFSDFVPESRMKMVKFLNLDPMIPITLVQCAISKSNGANWFNKFSLTYNSPTGKDRNRYIIHYKINNQQFEAWIDSEKKATSLKVLSALYHFGVLFDNFEDYGHIYMEYQFSDLNSKGRILVDAIQRRMAADEVNDGAVDF